MHTTNITYTQSQALDRLLQSTRHYTAADRQLLQQAARQATWLEPALAAAQFMQADSITVLTLLDYQHTSTLNLRQMLQALHIQEEKRQSLQGGRPLSAAQASAITNMLRETTDMRVLLAWLAELLVHLQQSQDAEAAFNTQRIYAPLAGQLGLYLAESRLQDQAFAILEPQAFAWTQQRIALGTKQRQAYVTTVCSLLHKQLRSIGVTAHIYGRVKHAYSYYRKLQTVAEATSLDEVQAANPHINDTIGFRIVVESEADCYRVLHEVHQLWQPLPQRIKDFIAKPKRNGYQSLHTTVICLGGRSAEIQIRTNIMHQYAEYGPAMHWHYKAVGDNASAIDQPVVTGMQQAPKFQLQEKTAANRIHVLTPKGDVLPLPAGSTPIDFAYRIHTTIGHHCFGALVLSADDGYNQRRMVPLHRALSNGDVVSIITHATSHPTPNWLEWAKSKQARGRITRYVQKNAPQAIVQRSETLSQPTPRRHALRPALNKQPSFQGLLTVLAGCCQPQPPEPVVGLVSRRKGLVIHRQDCKNIVNLHQADQQRLLPTNWD